MKWKWFEDERIIGICESTSRDIATSPSKSAARLVPRYGSSKDRKFAASFA
jgi:hypothetical protein